MALLHFGVSVPGPCCRACWLTGMAWSRGAIHVLIHTCAFPLQKDKMWAASYKNINRMLLQHLSCFYSSELTELSAHLVNNRKLFVMVLLYFYDCNWRLFGLISCFFITDVFFQSAKAKYSAPCFSHWKMLEWNRYKPTMKNTNAEIVVSHFYEKTVNLAINIWRWHQKNFSWLCLLNLATDITSVSIFSPVVITETFHKTWSSVCRLTETITTLCNRQGICRLTWMLLPSAQSLHQITQLSISVHELSPLRATVQLPLSKTILATIYQVKICSG